MTITSQHPSTLICPHVYFLLDTVIHCTALSFEFAPLKLLNSDRHFGVKTHQGGHSLSTVIHPSILPYFLTLSSTYHVSININPLYDHRHERLIDSPAKLDPNHQVIFDPAGDEEMYMCLARHKMLHHLRTRGKHPMSSEHDGISINWCSLRFSEMVVYYHQHTTM